MKIKSLRKATVNNSSSKKKLTILFTDLNSNNNKMNKIRRIIENYGLYVFLGGLALIGIVPIPFLSDLNTSIFIQELTPLSKRFLGCFLVLQGCVRLNYTIHKQDRLVMTSFVIDALLFTNEFIIMDNIEFWTGIFVVGTSLFMATFCYVFGEDMQWLRRKKLTEYLSIKDRIKLHIMTESNQTVESVKKLKDKKYKDSKKQEFFWKEQIKKLDEEERKVNQNISCVVC